jgi:hypothetical protein
MTTPLVSQEKIQSIRQIDLVQEDALWEKQRVKREEERAQKARQRLVVLLGDLFKTFPDVDRVWLGFNEGQSNPWSWAIRVCETAQQVEELSRVPWERFKETCTPEELTIRSVFGLVRAWGTTMGNPLLSSGALSRLFPDNLVLTREEFGDTYPYLLNGDRALDANLREQIRLEKRGQELDGQLPAPASPRPGPRF